jgi:hypothetical protein
MRPRPWATLPVHRSIFAVDIENSTQRTNPVKEELRQHVYRLVVEALSAAGIDDHYYDPFTDRGDGVLVLVHPADEFPKPLLLSRLMPALASLLVTHNSSISPAEQPRILRLRAVIHGSGRRVPAARRAEVQGAPAPGVGAAGPRRLR